MALNSADALGGLFDVAVCGGTLGVIAAAALARRGLRVVLLERGEVRGREQEWNISRKEMADIVEAGALSEAQVEAAIASEFNPVRVAFHKGFEGEVTNVLNLGVSPAKLVAEALDNFRLAGGKVLERTALSGVDVHADGAVLRGEGGAALLRARLVVDAMGNASPAANQFRGGAAPDAVCMVVGTCAKGYEPEANTGGDLIVTCDEASKNDLQYFWEAFPASGAPDERTTYMFSYLDADSRRPSLEAMLEDYWPRLERYQGVCLDDLQVQRLMFALFPAYRDSPLRAPLARVLQVGDASGVQSPMSFGGFGALSRHLARTADGVAEALLIDAMDAESLGLLNPYLPNLSAQWAFYDAMKLEPGSVAKPGYDRDFISKMMTGNFSAMRKGGDAVMRPFLQDVPSFEVLGRTLGQYMLDAPRMVPSLVFAVGPANLAAWVRHYIAMGAYQLAHGFFEASPSLVEALDELLPPRVAYALHRRRDAWKFGSGMDYKYSPALAKVVDRAGVKRAVEADV